ncbi:hypothetical protein EDC01DRAFT_652122 [Geopyxis carbonaria]|nr:hypothetical protein EDC01DRAFT_652122 [Geopyxis carbonaria]
MIPPVLSHGLTLLAKDTGNPHPRTTSLMEKETDRYFVIWEKVCCWLKHEENEKKVFDLDDTVAISFDNKPGHPAIYITTDNRTSLKPEVLRTILIENGLIPEEERNCIRFYSRIGKFQRCSTDSVPKNAGYQPHPMSGASIGFTESALPDMAAFNSGTLCCHHLFAEDGSTRRFLPSASKEVDVQQPSYWHSEFLGRRERRGLPHELRFGRLHYSSGYDICEMGNFQVGYSILAYI